MSTGTETTVPVAVRSPGLDRLRGLAIAAMIVDHLCLVLAGPEWVRLTVGRIAVPIFFVLAGHLAGRIRARHLYVGLLGVALPVMVPWIDRPNVLLIWSVGCILLAATRYLRVPPVGLVIIGLTFAANGYGLQVPGAYELTAMFGLMALGAMLPRQAFNFAGVLPAPAGLLGRHPIAIYVGHLLLIQAALLGVAQ